MNIVAESHPGLVFIRFLGHFDLLYPESIGVEVILSALESHINGVCLCVAPVATDH